MKVDKKFDINYIDSSSLSCFSRCPMKYMLERLEGLQEPERNSLAVDYGTCMHHALPLCFEDRVEDAKQIFREKWTEFGYSEFEDDKRNIANAELAIDIFYMQHIDRVCPYELLKLDKHTIDIKDKQSEGEIPFLIDIGGRYPLAGRIDQPIRWKATGWIYAMDYKTTAEISPRFFNNFSNNPQANCYTLALSVLTGETCKGMVIEAIRVSKNNQESQLHPIPIQEHQTKRFLEWVNMKAEQIYQYNEAGIWPSSPSGCGSYSMFYSPGFMCPYKRICDCPDEIQPSIMDSYVRNIWHPFKIEESNI
jgi:hypothetical protein